MRGPVRRDVEPTGADEHEDLAPRVLRSARDREEEEVDEQAADDEDDADSDREGQPNAAAERLTIDRGDARRIAVQEIAPSLHRGDRPPESKGAKIRCLSRLQLADQIVANFLLDRARPRAGSPQVTERLKWGNHGPILSHRARTWRADYTTSPLSHPFFTARRPLVFAHRGGSALAPENTTAAFERGLALGANGLELDVHLSRDGVVVVHHDRRLERTTNLTGPIANRTADELARADAGYFFPWGPPSGGPIRLKPDPTGADFRFRGCGVSIPTLAAVLDKFRDVPIITFVNKLDREARDPFDLLDEIEQSLALDVTPASWPIGMGRDFLGTYDLFADALLLFERGVHDRVVEPVRCNGLDDPSRGDPGAWVDPPRNSPVVGTHPC